MEIAAPVLIAIVGLALARAIGPFVLGFLAWVGAALIALSLLTGVPVPVAAVAGVVALWCASQALSRAKHGEWRSALLRRFV